MDSSKAEAEQRRSVLLTFEKKEEDDHVAASR
jgi:hypothetical protein